MKAITEHIDKEMQSAIGSDGFMWFGLAELMIKGTQPHPVTIPDRKQVSLKDNYNGIVYHRVLSMSPAESADFSFGSRLAVDMKVRMRTVLAFKVAKFEEEFIFTFVKTFPQELFIDGYKLIDLPPSKNVIVDQEAVYKTEFGGGDYEKHIVTYNIFAIEYEIDTIKCC